MLRRDAMENNLRKETCVVMNAALTARQAHAPGVGSYPMTMVKRARSKRRKILRAGATHRNLSSRRRFQQSSVVAVLTEEMVLAKELAT